MLDYVPFGSIYGFRVQGRAARGRADTVICPVCDSTHVSLQMLPARGSAAIPAVSAPAGSAMATHE